MLKFSKVESAFIARHAQTILRINIPAKSIVTAHSDFSESSISVIGLLWPELNHFPFVSLWGVRCTRSIINRTLLAPVGVVAPRVTCFPTNCYQSKFVLASFITGLSKRKLQGKFYVDYTSTFARKAPG